MSINKHVINHRKQLMEVGGREKILMERITTSFIDAGALLVSSASTRGKKVQCSGIILESQTLRVTSNPLGR